MIIHCLACGKPISSNGHNCPYCYSEISEITLEMNGIEEKSRMRERFLDLLTLGFTHK